MEKRRILIMGLLCVTCMGAFGCGESLPFGENSDTDAAESMEQETLSGTIVDISDMQFTVRELKAEEECDDTELSQDGINGLVYREMTVIYEEDTLFLARELYKGSSKYRDFDASPKDLGREMNVSVWGRAEGKAFYADAVMIYRYYDYR